MAMEFEKRRCVNCGACIDVCPVDARKIGNDEICVEEELCVDCKACAEACDHNAIQIPEDQIPKRPEGA